MPTIAIFNGVIIQMFFENNDPPHVHAIYFRREGTGEHRRWRNHPRRASQEAGEIGKRMSETEACRVDGELASCANGRCFRIAGPND
jgi:hypothetical protein